VTLVMEAQIGRTTPGRNENIRLAYRLFRGENHGRNGPSDRRAIGPRETSGKKKFSIRDVQIRICFEIGRLENGAEGINA